MNCINGDKFDCGNMLSLVQVFLKYYHIERLWQIVSNYDRHATAVQKMVRGWIARKRVEQHRRELTRIAAATVIQTGKWLIGTN